MTAILILIQIAIDVIFALALATLIAARISGRTFSEEWQVFRRTAKAWWHSLLAKFDGGVKPR